MEKLIEIPNRITREYLQAHPTWKFVFACDVAEKSFFGQAYQCYGEPNAYPVPTMLKACKSSGYFQDSMYDDIREYIDKALSAIPKNDYPTIILPRIGQGHSRMFEMAPKSFAYLTQELNKLRNVTTIIKYGI